MDVMPTLLHLVGIDSKNYLMFGSDMFSKQHNNVVPFRNGDFITEDYKYVNGKFTQIKIMNCLLKNLKTSIKIKTSRKILK